MRRRFFAIIYVLLSAAALIVAGGAPIPWSGSGGGTFLNIVAFLP